MRTRIVTAITIVGLISAAPLMAQTVVNDRVAKGMPSRFTPPTCGIKAGHFKVQSGATYLKTGIETSVPENKTRALKSGKKVLLEAAEQNQQDKNPALWYYLGRIYLQEGDIVGADSSLTRAETLLPPVRRTSAKYATPRGCHWSTRAFRSTRKRRTTLPWRSTGRRARSIVISRLPSSMPASFSPTPTRRTAPSSTSRRRPK